MLYGKLGARSLESGKTFGANSEIECRRYERATSDGSQALSWGSPLTTDI